MTFKSEPLFEYEVQAEEGYTIQEYDITSSPNDFNVKTIVDFIERSVFRIPVFQRNYVWDLNRASKLIESIILGLPIPQIFLYEQAKNSFLVIDGQQRLMSVYYFLKMRFPLMERRNDLRVIFDREGKIPSNIFSDDNYFSKFNLRLPAKLPGETNKLHGLNYETLEDLQTTFELKTIRCVFVKQNLPNNDDSVFEIFNRLNTGGVNLTPQEIRASLYYSDFMTMVARFNTDERWRVLVNQEKPDLRMRDIEVLLRGFAMLVRGDDYSPSMTRFLNKFAKDMQKASPMDLVLFDNILNNFLNRFQNFPPGVLGTRFRTKRLNISVFEAVFSAVCKAGYVNKSGYVPEIDQTKIEMLKTDARFAEAVSTKSTNTTEVETRLKRAREILLG